MNLFKVFLCCIVTSVICFAEGDESKKWDLSGWGFFTFGSVRSSPLEIGLAVKDYMFDKEALADFDAGLKTTFVLGRNTKARFHLGFSTAYLVPDHSQPNSVEFLRRRFVAYIVDAAIEKKVITGSGANELFVEFGYFPVKYNAESRNLGEYLFRSGTYYPTINSGFELADKEKLTGVHGRFTHNFSEKSDFKADLYFTNDMRDYPVHDFSLSYILTANLSRVLEVSAGAMHAHLIVADKRKTTPYYDKTLFTKSPDGTRIYDVIMPDYPNVGDTAIYTFKGTKLMGRVTFDIKNLFGGEGILGKEDCKIYGETAILGLKNYPIWYEDITERWPIMVGFNFPTFKLLDVLSIELEHNPSPYTNTAERVWKNRSPIPYIPGHKHMDFTDDSEWPDGIPGPITNDDFKWSVYASRKFGHFRVSAQVASDHMIRSQYMLGPPTSMRYTELCPKSTDWYWMTRVSYYF